MTTIYMDGFEQYGVGTVGNANMLRSVWAEVQSNGSLGVLETPAWGARTGTLALTCINTSESNRYAFPTTEGEVFLSFGFSLGSMPSSNFQSQLCAFRTAGNVDIARLWCQTNGTIVLTDGSNTILASTSGPVITSLSTWYFFEMDFDQAGGNFTLRINDTLGTGTPAIAATGLALGSTAVGMLTFVGSSRLQLDWVDDIFIRDTSGTVNNSWLGNRWIATIPLSGTSPYRMPSPPATTTLVSALQITYEAYGGLDLVTPGGTYITTPGGMFIGVPTTISSTLVGPLGGTTTDTDRNLSGTPYYYNDIYELDPDTTQAISPITIIDGAVEINSPGSATVVQIFVLVAYGSGIYNTDYLPAWTFVLDGHRFYVLSLGPEGDWAYDLTTHEWCQLQSQGFPGLNFTHGVMWGMKIMGGDALYVYLHELNPVEPLDETWREVKHMVTGGIATRTRSVIGVANFTVTASVGLDSEEDQPISLAYSDDNGVTWSPEFGEPLTDMSTQSLIWNALGSFAAPGRVFRITDYSGPIRLDGADVVLTIGTGADSGQESDGQQAH